MKTTKHLPAFFILFFYTILSLFRLGHPYAPSTSWEAEEKATPIFLDFGEEKDFSALVFYLGNYENRRFAVQVGSGSPIRWTDLGEITIRRVYQWSRFPLKARGRYLRLTTLNQYTEIREMLVKDGEGALILPVNKANYPRLFDESRMYPGYGSFLSGTVFDESVFARTAYEHLHGLRSYEDTHPPLGKLIISLGIAGFGMNPFGWRIAGVIAGSLLLLVVWAFGLRLFSDRRVSVGVLLLLAFDCLHFTESRLGQVDSFLVLFMTGMNYFMFRYYEVMVEGDGKKSWRFLLGSGLCMGLAASCKWSGLYGGLGLALIWFAVVLSRGKKGQMSQKEFLSTCGFCCLAFILLPIAVYLLSYIPYVAFDETMGFWERVLANQKNMLQYHLHVGSEHESASAWFQWLCSAKPVRLLTVHFSDGDMEGLVLMGNPAFWWTGIAVVFFCLYQMAEKAEGRLGFLLTAYAAPILPWMGISRYSFLYHYYPSIPFLVLLIGYWAEKRGRWGKCCLGLCVLASAVCFCLFYPVISALRVPQGYVAGWLEWLPGWDFIS